MKLTFLGTRGYIDPKTSRHRHHTSTMVSYKGKNVMIDCGEDWLGQVDRLAPRAILITHAHPDHAFGLRDGAPCPVYAIQEAWAKMASFSIADHLRRPLQIRKPRTVEGLRFEAFSVVHSTRAPAVGYRVTAGAVSIFYVPDVVWIPDRSEAFKGIRVYVGDGATITRSMVRKERKSKKLIGHTPIRTQLTWCQKEGVPKMIVTHCGSAIVGADERKVKAQLRSLARERGVEVELAYDGMERVLR